MKYIIFQMPSTLELPIIFSDLIDHIEMASKFPYMKVIGAGFCAITIDNDFRTFGKSTTLGLISKIEDEDILNRMLKY